MNLGLGCITNEEVLMGCKYKWNDYCLECIKLVEQISGLNRNAPQNLGYIIDRANKILELKKVEKDVYLVDECYQADAVMMERAHLLRNSKRGGS